MRGVAIERGCPLHHSPLIETEVGEEIIDGEEGQVRALNGKKTCSVVERGVAISYRASV